MKFFLLVLLLFHTAVGHFALSAYDPASKPAESGSLQEIRREIRNQQQSVKALQEAQENYSTILDSFRKEFRETTKASKEFVSHASDANDSKMAPLEASIKALVADIKQVKNHLDELQGTLSQFKEKIAELERSGKAQSKKMAHLETSFGHVMEALAPAAGPSNGSTNSGGGQAYQVKSGDSLGRIAYRNNTTIRAIKEANNLSSDQIQIGQTLIIPQ